MSENNPSLPSADAAQRVILQLDAEQYFAKMAELGRAPQSEQDAIDMLELGFMVEQMERDPALAKQAGAGSVYGEAKQNLLKLAQANVSPATAERQYKQAAEGYLANPAVGDAALALLIYQAQSQVAA